MSSNRGMPSIDIHTPDAIDATNNIDPSPLIGDDQSYHTYTLSISGNEIEFPKKGSINADTDPHGAPSPPTWRRPISSARTYFTELSGFFSWKFLSWLAIDQCFISGGSLALVTTLSLPLFKELGIGAARQQLYMSMILSPFAMKPFIGVASDLFPIRGYNKKYFALYSILIGLLGCSVLLGLYHSGAAEMAVLRGEDATQRLADIIVVCFTAVVYEAAALDILGEGKYAELMRDHPESGSSIISFKFGCAMLGSLVTTIFVGPLSDAGHFHVLFWITLVLSLMPLYPTLAGWIPERLRTFQEPGMVKLCKGCLYDQGSFQEKKMPFIVITLCGLSAPMLAAVTTYADLAIGLVSAAVLLITFLVSTYYIFPRTFFRVFLSIVILYMASVSIGSALGYYYTASEECVPNGPNFSYTYYVTVTGIVGSVVNFSAVILYEKFLSTWRFRPVLIVTIVIGSLASIVDLIIIMRWNVAIGIPDTVLFLLGNAVFENCVMTLQAIPFSAIFAKMAPPGMESAVFAYTVGIANFCGMVSSLLGSGVIQWSGMVTVGDTCDFKALPTLIVIFQMMVPILVGIPAVFLIPNVLQTEQLIDWEKEGWSEDNSAVAQPSEQGNGTNNFNADSLHDRRLV